MEIEGLVVYVNCSCKSNNFILSEQNREWFFVTCISILYTYGMKVVSFTFSWMQYVFAQYTRIMNHTFSSFENLQLWEQKTIFIQQKIGKKFSTILNAFFIILFVLKMVYLLCTSLYIHSQNAPKLWLNKSQFPTKNRVTISVRFDHIWEHV